MNQPITYTTSRDYAELARQMQERRIVCFVDYGGGPDREPCRDVALARYFDASIYAPYRIQSRGIGYVEGTMESFIAQCQGANVDWIPAEPTEKA